MGGIAWLQKAEDEIFITMQLIFHAFSPKSIDHSKLFTPIYISILWIIFWYVSFLPSHAL